MSKTAYIAGTFDTKEVELLFVRDLIKKQGLETVTVDLRTSAKDTSSNADISAYEVANMHPDGADAVFTGDRGTAVAAMADAFKNYLAAQNDLGGVIGFGGSGGTALISPAFQNLPIGIPKIIVSTVASGNIAPYVGEADISMVYSITDISGLNPILEQVLSNAAHSLSGMISNRYIPAQSAKPVVGMTMFGVTTICVGAVKSQLEQENQCLVFHATGTGGRTLEKLVNNGMISGVIDSTTTEVADHLMGGILSAGEERLDAFINNSIPYVGSCGAVDMVNFGAPETIPEKYSNRLFYNHNPQITLMRTTATENDKMGKWIGNKLNQFKAPARFLIPLNGFSALDIEGGAFYDQSIDTAFIDALERTLKPDGNVTLIKLPYHINDAEFSNALAENYLELTK
ncbi:MAG: Tm-1-like ATP-binding domain-containing protein [Kordiimonadaceae bacterium]|nr:Tm-1-like ATP-binding domain-containing protein [Kordiimonadaceae bacterium]MBT6036004.1 Tm-1-like ATP-binding domain-containing protein [Kordiimonadaceae bacterium]MBT6328572.1 Tm-1-like ATP-binding domain-containing protein [Kordiimonadaceae bacterium]MBT7581846.1 Tm-1-like ATP-binding domain-containing protein [Kordiimonadaceae bacterium]